MSHSSFSDDEQALAEADGDEQQAAMPRRSCIGRVFRFFLISVFAVLLGMVGLGIYIDHFGHQNNVQSAQAIVILGARVTPEGIPGDSLRARTEQAVRLYKQGYARRIICTGGLGDYPPCESEAAAQLAMTLGAPEKDIIQENASKDTRQNVHNAALICRRHGWTKVIAVSDPYHLWRVRRNFSLEGIEAYTSPALDCQRETQWTMRVQWVAREVLAVIRDVGARR